MDSKVPKMSKSKIVIIVLAAALTISVGLNVFQYLISLGDEENMSNNSEVYDNSDHNEDEDGDDGENEGEPEENEVKKDDDDVSADGCDEQEYIPYPGLKGPELSDKKVLDILEAKRKKLGYDGWVITSAKIIGYNKNRSIYMVSYKDKNKDGYDEGAFLVMKYKEDGSWDFDLPGVSGTAEDLWKKYDLIKP